MCIRDRVVSVDIPFVNGKNVVDAVIEKEGREYRDQYVCDFKCVNVKDVYKRQFQCNRVQYVECG